MKLSMIIGGLSVWAGLMRAAPAELPPKLISLQDTLTYVAEPAPYKTYVKGFETPAGREVLLDAPADHIHHHALMFAIGAGDTDFWSEFPDGRPGKQQPRETTRTPSGLTQVIDWITAANQPLLEERRTLRLQKTPALHLLTWRSQLKPAAGQAPVKLWGRHYFGLGFRFIREFDGKAQFLFPGDPTGRVVRGDERLTPADWCACQGTVNGQAVTVVMFGHPANPRHPAEWFTMAQPFAYLSATLGLEEKPMDLPAQKTLTLTYGIALADGHVDPDQIQQYYTRWQGDLPVNPKPSSP